MYHYQKVVELITMKTKIFLPLFLAIFLVPVSSFAATRAARAPKPVAASITVVSPNGGEVYTVGDTITIKWSSTGTVGNVWLALAEDANHMSWIATGIPNTGSYTWVVNPGGTSITKFYIKILGTDSKGILSLSDTSNSTFTIKKPPLPTLSLSASPISIAYGASSLISWSSTNATSCTASGAWSGAKSTSGTQDTGALTSSKSFYLSCTGTGGTVAKSVFVSVAAPIPAPTLNFTAASSSIAYGANTNLSWSTTNATSCTASGAWSGAKSTSGSSNTGALTASQTYSLSCTGPSGTVSKNVTVTVAPAPLPRPGVIISADDMQLQNGEATTIRWGSVDATSCTASGAWSGTVATSGSYATGALFSSKTYNLSCTGPGGTSSVAITVQVATVEAPFPTLTFTAEAVTVPTGTSATLHWSTTDAGTCTAWGAWSGTQATSGTLETGPLTQDKVYSLRCEGPGGYSNYVELFVNVFGSVNLYPNSMTLQQAVDSGLSLNCVEDEVIPSGKGPDYMHRYYFQDGKVRSQSEEIQLDGTLIRTYTDIFYPGIALYHTYASTVPYTTFLPGAAYYESFASYMNTRTLSGYRCNHETLDSALFVPTL